MVDRTCYDCGESRPVYELGDGESRCGLCLAARTARAEALLDEAVAILRLRPGPIPADTVDRTASLLDRYRATKERKPPAPTRHTPSDDDAAVARFSPAILRCLEAMRQRFVGVFPATPDRAIEIRNAAHEWLEREAREQGPWLVSCEIDCDPFAERRGPDYTIDARPDFAKRIERLGPRDAYDPRVDYWRITPLGASRVPTPAPDFVPRADPGSTVIVDPDSGASIGRTPPLCDPLARFRRSTVDDSIPELPDP